jgi:hypothetical protein
MCDDPTYYYMTMDERDQKARKEHICCACKETIRIGDRYRVSRLVSDDPDHRFEFYKHCLRCAAMLDAIRAARPDAGIRWELDCGEDWKDTIGDLPDDIASLAFMTSDEAQEHLLKPAP